MAGIKEYNRREAERKNQSETENENCPEKWKKQLEKLQRESDDLGIIRHPCSGRRIHL